MDLIGWIIIGVLVFIGLTFLKVEHAGKKIKWVVLILLGLLLFFSISAMLSSGEYDLSTPEGVVNSMTGYFGWLGDTFVNLWEVGEDTVGAVGDAVKIDNGSG